MDRLLLVAGFFLIDFSIILRPVSIVVDLVQRAHFDIGAVHIINRLPLFLMLDQVFIQAFQDNGLIDFGLKKQNVFFAFIIIIYFVFNFIMTLSFCIFHH